MTFKIVVCIKQVPDTTDIRWTEHNTIQRDGLDSVINPYDIGAINLANYIKSLNKEVQITVVTMGPFQAQDALREALAMGCDEAYLLSDKKFSGADTLATAYTLSQFIKNIVPDFKLVICGQQAVDGDTAQTPSSLAEKLDIAQATNITKLINFSDDCVILKKETQFCTQEIKLPLPSLVAFSCNNTEINPDISSYIRSQNSQIKILNAEELSVSEDNIGLKGSPTQVKKAYRPVITRTTELLEEASSETYADFILSEINKCRADNG